MTHDLVDNDFLDLVRNVARQGQEQEREVRTRNGDWFQMRILPYHISVTFVSGVVLTFIDIGLFKAVQDMLSDRETLISSLYRAAPVGISRIVNRTFLEVNDQLCQTLGLHGGIDWAKRARLLYPSTAEFEAVGQISTNRSANTALARWNPLAPQGRHGVSPFC